MDWRGVLGKDAEVPSSHCQSCCLPTGLGPFGSVSQGTGTRRRKALIGRVVRPREMEWTADRIQDCRCWGSWWDWPPLQEGLHTVYTEVLTFGPSSSFTQVDPQHDRSSYIRLLLFSLFSCPGNPKRQGRKSKIADQVASPHQSSKATCLALKQMWIEALDGTEFENLKGTPKSWNLSIMSLIRKGGSV